MWQLGPGSPIFFMGFSRQMKKTILIHMMLACGFLFIFYRLGFFHPLRQLFSSKPNRWDLLSSFPAARGDAAQVTWFHRANSRQALKDAVKGKYMMIEADILTTSSGTAIMAHPPETSSDLTFDIWLRSVKNVEKGIKLDFKTLESVAPSLKSLSDVEDELFGPVVVNADILKGPYAEHSGLHADKFLAMFKKHFPKGMLSIGWTTGDGDSGYSWKHVYQMLSVIKRGKLKEAQITFPVRASLMNPNALKKLLWLLEVVPDSSLTVFAGLKDNRKSVDDLLLMRFLVPKHALFLDIAKAYPLSALQSFQKGLMNEDHLARKFADFLVDMSNLKSAWDTFGSPEGTQYLSTYSLVSSGHGAALVSQFERHSSFVEQTNCRTFFFPFSTNGQPIGKCTLEIVFRHKAMMNNGLQTPPGVVSRLDLPSGRVTVEAVGDREIGLVEERLMGLGPDADQLAYRLSVQDDGQRVAFVVTVVERYDEAEMGMRTSKRIVLFTKMNADVFFRPAIIAKCSNPGTMFVLHDLKV